MPPLAEAIAAHRFAADMEPQHLKKLLDVAMFKQFEQDQIVFREGEPANRFYLICHGKIALESRHTGHSVPVVQFVGGGEVLGWSWLFPPYYWHFDARAVEPTSAIFFYGTRLRKESEEDPAFGYELMKRVAAVVIKRLQIVRVQWLQLQQESTRKASPA
jgi:CRP-like cAMP-binding protein